MTPARLSRERIEAAVRESLELARRGALRVEPNPPVGAVVLDAAGEVVGRGWHTAYGSAHAEPAALAQAGAAARGGTLVVTLEPCAHEAKKTPPCVRAIVASGVACVVAATRDPNPTTSGRAARVLAEAGVEYAEGVLEPEARALLARYERHLGSDLPWTLSKWAMSADGRIADASGRARWISGSEARALVHDLRGRVEAVVVGRGTVEADDPLLTARDAASPLPPALRVVFDSQIRTPTYARLVTGAAEVPTLLVCTPSAPAERRRVVERAGVEVLEAPAAADGRVDVREAFAALRRRGVRRTLLEAGASLNGAALRAGVVHQVLAFVAPVLIGGAGPSPFAGDGWAVDTAPRLEDARVLVAGHDAVVEGYWPAPTVSSTTGGPSRS